MLEFKASFDSLEVAIVENDPIFLDGLRNRLEKMGCRVVWVADSRESALQEAVSCLPNIVFIDLGLKSDRSIDSREIGRRLILDLRGINPHVGIVIYSVGPPYEPVVLEAIKMGCSYLIKENVVTGYVQEIVAAALLAAHSKSVILSHDVARAVDIVVNKLKGLDELTETERRVLKLAADGLSNQEIADELRVSINTVKSHMQHICKKICVDSRGKAIKWFYDHYGS